MIDSHQHLIYPGRFRYSWTKNLPALQKEFGLDQYLPLAGECGIAGSVFMEADVDGEQSGEEARFFLALSENPANRILGVIAACRPEEEGFTAALESLVHPSLKGVRRILHNQADGLARDAGFQKNIRRLGGRSLTFDICCLARQLPAAIALADACPGTGIMLDHCGGPDIAAGALEPWSEHIRDIARRPNVRCKISGIPSNAAPGMAGVETLRPWFGNVLESFGADRLVWGGDWPVCNLNSSLPDWVNITHALLAPLSESERKSILSENARRFYRLPSP